MQLYVQLKKTYNQPEPQAPLIINRLSPEHNSHLVGQALGSDGAFYLSWPSRPPSATIASALGQTRRKECKYVDSSGKDSFFLEVKSLPKNRNGKKKRKEKKGKGSECPQGERAG